MFKAVLKRIADKEFLERIISPATVKLAIVSQNDLFFQMLSEEQIAVPPISSNFILDRLPLLTPNSSKIAFDAMREDPDFPDTGLFFAEYASSSRAFDLIRHLIEQERPPLNIIIKYFENFDTEMPELFEFVSRNYVIDKSKTFLFSLIIGQQIRHKNVKNCLSLIEFQKDNELLKKGNLPASIIVKEAIFAKLYPVVERIFDIGWMDVGRTIRTRERHMMLKDGQEKLLNKILSRRT